MLHEASASLIYGVHTISIFVVITKATRRPSIVDESQNLDWDLLVEIRPLGNLENRRGVAAT